MAGSAMTFTKRADGRVTKIVAAWTSDDSTGAVSGTTTFPVDGELIGFTTIPGTAGDAPTADYDVAITDSDGHDVLLGAGANRHTSNTEHVSRASLACVAHSLLTFAVTNAGNSNKGTIVLYVNGVV